MDKVDRIKAHIVDDHQIFRTGLKVILAGIPYVSVIGESSNGAEFLAQIQVQLPDIVFMDIKMPVMDGLKATELALSRYPDLRIIIMSSIDEEESINQLIHLGISGFMLKNTDTESLEKAIKQVLSGNNYFSAEIMSAIVRSLNRQTRRNALEEKIEFSDRELEVLNLIGKGFSNKEIAEKLFISHRTVEGHKSRLIQKTGQVNSLSLILWAMKNNIIQPG